MQSFFKARDPMSAVLEPGWRRLLYLGSARVVGNNNKPPIEYLNFIAGISSWGKRVGRRLDQLRTSESGDRVQYSVNPVLVEETERWEERGEAGGGTDLRRRVSRVESLRRLLLGASADSRRLFDKRRHRFDRRSAVKVDKAIGTEAEFRGVSEEDLFDRTSSRFDVSCESFDLDSISQMSLADSSTGVFKDSLGNSKSISSDNIPSDVLAYHNRSTFPHSFVKSKLAVLPEEQGTLTRDKDKRPRPSSVMDTPDGGQESDAVDGPQSLTSDCITSTSTLRRKRSQSLAGFPAKMPDLELVLHAYSCAGLRFPGFLT